MWRAIIIRAPPDNLRRCIFALSINIRLLSVALCVFAIMKSFLIQKHYLGSGYNGGTLYITVVIFHITANHPSASDSDLHDQCILYTQANRERHSYVLMSAMAPQTTGVSIVCSGADWRKHQSPASLVFVRGIHRWPLESSHKGSVTWKCFHFMTSSRNVPWVWIIEAFVFCLSSKWWPKLLMLCIYINVCGAYTRNWLFEIMSDG